MWLRLLIPVYFQDFAFRAEIAVLLRHVGERVDALEISRLPIRIFFHRDVTCDAPLIEPLQQFAVALGGIRRQRLRQIVVVVAEPRGAAFGRVGRIWVRGRDLVLLRNRRFDPIPPPQFS